jgi:hypothetical protein
MRLSGIDFTNGGYEISRGISEVPLDMYVCFQRFSINTDVTVISPGYFDDIMRL